MQWHRSAVANHPRNGPSRVRSWTRELPLPVPKMDTNLPEIPCTLQSSLLEGCDLWALAV